MGGGGVVNEPFWTDGERTIHHGDCLDLMRGMEAESVSLCLTDPPYGVQFMGKAWDRALPDPAIWSECLRLLKPGGFLFAFMTPRTDCFARFCVQVEDAGFDCSYYPIQWVYLSGFPKGHDLSKAADKEAGSEREVVGSNPNARPESQVGYSLDGIARNFDATYGPLTAPSTPLAQRLDGWKAGRQVLKPAHETILVAQKPLAEKTFLANVKAHGTGGMNTGAAAVPFEGEEDFAGADTSKWAGRNYSQGGDTPWLPIQDIGTVSPAGRHPANVAVTDAALGPRTKYFDVDAWAAEHVTFTDESVIAYCPKAGKAEKNAGLDMLPDRRSRKWRDDKGMRLTGSGNPRREVDKCNHPTCKPLALISWLLTLGLPTGGLALDPFMGSGTTLVAAKALGMRATGIELNETEDEPYCTIAAKRVEAQEEPQATLFDEASG